MKKILLVGINARYTHSNPALYYLKSSAADRGYDIIIREFSINLDAGRIIDAVTGIDPDAVAFSVYIWNIEIINRIIPALMCASGRPVLILGGPEVSYNPESWLSLYPDINYIITGPGENAFRRLLESGLTSDNQIISVPNPPFREIGLPYSDDDLASLKKKYLYYESSRGCSFRCTYCLSSRDDQKFEAKDPDMVKDELNRILRHDPRIIKFVDRTFNSPGGSGREIWNYLLERHSAGPTLFHFEVHPLFLDDDDIHILSRAPAGKFQFEIGVQSTDPGTRAAIRRGSDWNREKEMILKLAGLGTIHIHLDLIAGLPGDDIDALARTFNELYHIGPDHLQVGILKVLPGTEMRERADEYGMAFPATPPYGVTRTAWLSEKEMELVRDISLLVDRLYNTRRCAATLAGLVRRYPDPFSLYRELAQYRTLHGGPDNRNWDEAAAFLLNFIRETLPGEVNYFLDALQWDWCSTARSRRPPDIIRPENGDETRQKGIAFFRGFAADGTVSYRGATISEPDIKRAPFFRARTELFSSEYMDGNPCALFLPGKKIILYNDSRLSV